VYLFPLPRIKGPEDTLGSREFLFKKTEGLCRMRYRKLGSLSDPFDAIFQDANFKVLRT
jgi:hypothetical protein